MYLRNVKKERVIQGATAALLWLAAVLFWWKAVPQALSYQEQLQLFLFDGDYLWERIAVPGGTARYIAEFLVQFYNNVLLGAIVIATLMVIIQQLTWRLCRCGAFLRCVLSLVPVVLVWLIMGDINVLLGLVVAVVMVLGAMVIGRRLNIWGNTLLTIATYWLAGPLTIILVFYAAWLAIKRKHYVLSPLPLVVLIAMVWFSCLVLPYPQDVLWCGIGYYRAPAMIPLPKGFDAREYELLDYDFLVRRNNWDAIISKAEKKTPDLPMSVSALNLALAMKGQLTQRAGDFYQHGSEGLIPPFDRNYNTTLVTAEIFFQLGLVNDAQRLTFEMMEAIPNYNKSARCIRRLAETNIINGQYDVARKYLAMLEKTLFYRRWAQRTKEMLGNEDAINKHPLYGYMRRMRLENDFLFSDTELDKICGQLVMHNKENSVAIQYLLAFPMLDGDRARLGKYVEFLKSER